MIPVTEAGITLAIQFAVAPALLLVASGNCLNVVAVRLARIVDRARSLEGHLPSASEREKQAEVGELRMLDRRMRICHMAVAFITASALLTCLVIITLFVSSLRATSSDQIVSILFVAAMGSLATGLLLFLAEVSIATRVVKVSREHVGPRRD